MTYRVREKEIAKLDGQIGDLAGEINRLRHKLAIILRERSNIAEEIQTARVK